MGPWGDDAGMDGSVDVLCEEGRLEGHAANGEEGEEGKEGEDDEDGGGAHGLIMCLVVLGGIWSCKYWNWVDEEKVLGRYMEIGFRLSC